MILFQLLEQLYLCITLLSPKEIRVGSLPGPGHNREPCPVQALLLLSRARTEKPNPRHFPLVFFRVSQRQQSSTKNPPQRHPLYNFFSRACACVFVCRCLPLRTPGVHLTQSRCCALSLGVLIPQPLTVISELTLLHKALPVLYSRQSFAL